MNFNISKLSKLCLMLTPECMYRMFSLVMKKLIKKKNSGKLKVFRGGKMSLSFPSRCILYSRSLTSCVAQLEEESQLHHHHHHHRQHRRHLIIIIIIIYLSVYTLQLITRIKYLYLFVWETNSIMGRFRRQVSLDFTVGLVSPMYQCKWQRLHSIM